MIKVVTYGQLRDALDDLIESGTRKASDPIFLNGRYWTSIVDSKNDNKVLAKGRVKVKPRPPDDIRLV